MIAAKTIMARPLTEHWAANRRIVQDNIRRGLTTPKKAIEHLEYMVERGLLIEDYTTIDYCACEITKMGK